MSPKNAVPRKAKKAPGSAPKKPAGPALIEWLLEIGTEEMPANYLAYAADPENDLFRKKFLETFAAFNESKAFAGGDVRVYLTPRRITLHVTKLAFDPSAKKEPVYGPAWNASFEPNGHPSKALEGFMKSRGITVNDIVEFENKGKKCAGYWKTEKPRTLAEIAGELVPAFVKSLTFPKLMKWDSSDLRFPRPIRNVLCLIDGKPVKFKLGLLESGNQTLFFENAARSSAKIVSVAAYFATLARRGVILDQTERRSKIEEEVKRLTEKHGGFYAADPGLLDEVAYLTERPVCVSGEFEGAFQHLPKEVLTVSLAKKQRLFSVFGRNGKHMPFFIGVLDGAVQKPDLVAKTIGAILKAKLQDSHFFYQEDAKIVAAADGLTRLSGDLKNLVYLKDLGSIHDKVTRMREAVDKLAPVWGVSDGDSADLRDAIGFSKIDLLTQMVGEFPELQGTIGGYYARLAKKPEPVALAIAEQYLPVSGEGRLPETRVGAALAILDKADLIVSCFVAGKIPSSSQDPYALKRSLVGIVRIAAAHRFDVSWRGLVAAFLDGLESQRLAPNLRRDAVAAQLVAFFRERAAYYFENSRGYAPDLVEAALATESDRLLKLEERISALAKIEREETFKRSLKIVQRTSNILKAVPKADLGQIDPARLSEPSEKDLFRLYGEKKEAISEAATRGDYGLATSLYAEAFFDILHVFFERVLVNSPEADVRRNRLSLLDAVRSLYIHRIADLSKIKQTAELES